MSAGKLTELLAFEARGEVDDGAGNVISGPFAEVFVTAASIRPLKGSEAVQASRLQGVQPVIVAIRNSAAARTVTADWQIRDKRSGTVYAITSPPFDMDRKRTMLEMMATAGKPS